MKPLIPWIVLATIPSAIAGTVQASEDNERPDRVERTDEPEHEGYEFHLEQRERHAQQAKRPVSPGTGTNRSRNQ